MTEGTHHHAPYFLIFIALCVCTILSVAADILQPPSKLVLIVIVLAIATAKALFVMAYFMHLKFEGRWKFLLLSPTIILACGIPLALIPDIGVHYYTDIAPQYVESGGPAEPETTGPQTPEPHH
jgi:cytochrome c oxidase subunit 4